MEYSHSQDLVIVKLNHDGSTAWNQTIESGKNYNIYDVLQTSDGGYALGGLISTPLCNPQCNGYENSTPTIIRLSNNGEVVSELDFPSELKDKSGHMYPILGLVQTPDNGFYAISETGTILSISPSGTSRGSRFIDTSSLNKTEITSITRTHDGGSIISGYTVPCFLKYNGVEECEIFPKDFRKFVEKLDQYGNTTWFRSDTDSGFSGIDQIIALNDDQGYASVMKNSSNNSLVMLDKNGTIVNSSEISLENYSYKLQPVTRGFSAFISQNINNTHPIYYYDDFGIRTNTVMLNNSYDSGPTIATSDSGYLSVNQVGLFFDVPKPTTVIHVLKTNDNGNLLWDRQVSSFVTDPYNVHIRNQIETSDGGYLIVLGIEKKGSLYK